MDETEHPVVGNGDRSRAAKLVRNAIFARRMRDSSFPAGLFGEPAWDILLDIYLSDIEQRRLSVGAACIGSAVPSTTALRWLQTLIDNGLVSRLPDQRDSRRYFVELTDKGRARMSDYFGRARSTWDGS